MQMPSGQTMPPRLSCSTALLTELTFSSSRAWPRNCSASTCAPSRKHWETFQAGADQAHAAGSWSDARETGKCIEHTALESVKTVCIGSYLLASGVPLVADVEAEDEARC